MTNNTFRLISCLLVLVFFFSIHTPVEASKISDYNTQQESLTTKKDTVKNQIKQTQAKKNTTLQDLEKINKNIEDTNNEISKLNNKLELAQENIETAKIEIAEKESELTERTEILEDRLCEIYKQGDASILEVLLDSTNISEFLTRFELFKKIAENDTELLASLENERKILDVKKVKLETEKQNIAHMKSSRESKKEELRVASFNKEELLKNLEKEKKEYEQSLDEIEKQSQQITIQIQKLQAENARANANTSTYVGASRSSTSIWPTPGYTRVTSPYGWRNHPILSGKRFHCGIDIGAPQGATAVAVAEGKIIYAGWNGAYGNTVIVDHGGGISTLYAHLSSFIASNGSVVSKNQPIARVGSTGQSTGPHLHFEVRQNGNHTNPYSFLK